MSESAPEHGYSECPFCHERVHATTHYPCPEQPSDRLTGENAADGLDEGPRQPAGEPTTNKEVYEWLENNLEPGESVETTAREIAIDLGATARGVGRLLGDMRPAIGPFAVDRRRVGEKSRGHLERDTGVGR